MTQPLALRLRQARHRAGLTLEKLAILTQMRVSVLSDRERGRDSADIRLKTLLKYCVALHRPVEWFVRGVDPQYDAMMDHLIYRGDPDPCPDHDCDEQVSLYQESA
jgi:transcriptional regulator with XRE-family HTH domain